MPISRLINAFRGGSGPKGNRDRILAAGDSHSQFWSGYNNLSSERSVFEGVDLLHVGPATAYGLSKPGTATRAIEKITDHLDRRREEYGCLLLSFGEIDCRVHIVRNAIINQTSLDAEVAKVVDRYLFAINSLVKKYDIPCIIWGPIPSSPPGKVNYHPSFPTVGGVLERNYAAKRFNELLAQKVGEGRIDHITIFDHLIDVGYVTKTEVLYDGCHLSNVVMPLAETELHKSLERLGLTEKLRGVLDRKWPVASSISMRNVAIGAKCTPSSVWKGFAPKPFGPKSLGKVHFHTNKDDVPSLLVSLDAAYLIRRVEVHNRSDDHAARAASIAISVSADGKEYVDVYSPDRRVAFGAGDDRLVVEIDHEKPVRFVKIYLRERSYLHLEHVSIWAPSFYA
ncbi:discoidin domain-containing protein [Aliirhizobium cellulosilyticum]|uniref:F5/8 type C domain-containing protein n=1 Tax=Aliirhizobium cellulosilyticum TaxID=393664 RepID=A0A7W6S7M7_9HYPH|nr:discoidin domain-containing protein [Rhizobium cellulosilyticum]MBB4348727.1 hypothetical protein [Rhizobium cellulosilyticum]MBB4411963.1 hypothetical protein [Rhizobium cellulosilyticum]MBB4449437.1 hypothetical protein [Rhizobium cellulosilyticum]